MLLKNICVHSINFVKFSALYIVVFDVETAPETAKLAILERQESFAR